MRRRRSLPTSQFLQMLSGMLGQSVSKGNIAIHCPFCGDADPSEHMGLRLDPSNPYWGCWRNPMHRGKNPLRLLTALLGGNERKAREMIREQSELHPEDSGEGTLANIAFSRISEAKAVRLPAGARALDSRQPHSRPFLDYLEDRGFFDPEEAADRYELSYAISGEYRWRIIYPVKFQGRVVSYTGRAVGKSEGLRYLTPSTHPIKHFVGNWDRCNQKGERLVIVEGPFDMMKVDFYTKSLRVVCTFGVSLSESQLLVLSHLIRTKYEAATVLFDDEAWAESAQLAEQLTEMSGKPVLGTTLYQLGLGAEDPGAMTQNQVLRLESRIAGERE